MSPGGTEIKPPPPRTSPKRSYRATPSPPRAKASPGVAEPESDIQKLANVLEGAFKAQRTGEGKVEDVKTVPELPKLEIKENEKELRGLAGPDRAVASEVQEAANSFYGRWLWSGPIDRLLMRPDKPNRFDSGPFVQSAGLKERGALLRYLTTPEAARSVTDALKRVRRWSRWGCRAGMLPCWCRA